MDGPLWIAAAGIGLGALTVVANWRMNVTRINTDTEMHSERLVHERRLVHEATAAEAYQLCEVVLHEFRWDAVSGHGGPRLEDVTELPDDLAAPWGEAVTVITRAKAYAWDHGMVVASAETILALVDLKNTTIGTLNRLGAMLPDELQTLDHVKEQYKIVWWQYNEAIEGYRRSISG